MQRSNQGKPSVLFRLGLLLGLGLFAALEANPLVRLEAALGLSPAPLERVVGIKNLFSGMTEGMHRLALLDMEGSLAANIFSPAVAVLLIVSILSWRIPRVASREREFWFFAAFLGLSVLVNLFHP